MSTSLRGVLSRIFSFQCKTLFSACLMASAAVCLAASPLDVNQATAQELAAVLSGVGQSKAEAIVAYRTSHGDFTSLEELTEVKGIGQSILAKNRDLLSVGPAEPLLAEEPSLVPEPLAD